MKNISNICSNRVIVDFRIAQESIDELQRLGYTVYKSSKIPTLYNEVCGHPDMQIHFINKKAFCAPEVYDYYNSLNLSDIELIKGSHELKAEYPGDVLYNVCCIGNYVISRPLCVAIEIFSEYQSIKKEFLNARQGYAKCSICVISDNSAITADEGMYKLLKSNKINVLKIQDGFIKLYDMKGFIGGASGLINNTLYFNGNIKMHPDYKNIKAFCKNEGVDIYSLNNGDLWDVGTIMSF